MTSKTLIITLRFVANDVAEYMPKEFEDIVINDNDVKKLNYIKMNAVLWGCVQEQMDKIEHCRSLKLKTSSKIGRAHV